MQQTCARVLHYENIQETRSITTRDTDSRTQARNEINAWLWMEASHSTQAGLSYTLPVLAHSAEESPACVGQGPSMPFTLAKPLIPADNPEVLTSHTCTWYKISGK